MPMHLLDNIPWHSLTGPHARYSLGTGGARRYAPGFSPIIAFANPASPDFAALEQFCAPGEHFYCGGLSGSVPSGWQIDAGTTANQMLWDAAVIPADDGALLAVRLGPSHVPQILELVAVTQPGPFAERTIELGEYLGVFEAGRLVAMAGERMAARGLREISGVCTHPDFQGRGLARRLVEKLIRLELARGETPFLHVMQDNSHARRIYERMGFRHHQEVALQIVSRQ
ncbi:GNAT family N-acetyltransferase [Variovorax sp. J22R133]|uniref:GNAT family N-acetyltransferase n=1 Tax=Variovorax brevis TaxID=3053503 RepID=UPI0025763B9A|nr:GNAT family N-acetyltransferase [Variovorax sp. J22R133]MDM0112307.1 GNAT family N-acetyltransferase [Variovorax sp. J22R133]